jgi:hypothetical protein
MLGSTFTQGVNSHKHTQKHPHTHPHPHTHTHTHIHTPGCGVQRRRDVHVQKLARGDSSLGAAWRDGEGEMTSDQAQTQKQAQAQAQATLAIDRLQISTWNIWCPLFRRLEGPGGTQRECEVEGMYLPRNLEVCKPSTSTGFWRNITTYFTIVYH